MPSQNYAVTRSLDPGKGDVLMDGLTWKQGQPMTEVVLRILRTPRGRYLPDPTFGVDYSAVNKALPGAGAAWRAAVLDALRSLIDRGYIANVAVTVDTAGDRLLYQVDFTDVQAQQRGSTGRLVF